MEKRVSLDFQKVAIRDVTYDDVAYHIKLRRESHIQAIDFPIDFFEIAFTRSSASQLSRLMSHAYKIYKRKIWKKGIIAKNDGKLIRFQEE